MSLASKFRWVPTPTYGKCGGASKSCAILREDLDPMDQLFFDHDWRCKVASSMTDPYEKEAAYKEADKLLHLDLKAMTEEDFKKIPYLQWGHPFFKRNYARAFRKASLALFK